MPPRGKSSDVVRLIYGRRGQIALRTELLLRFDYGSLVPWVTRLDDGGWRAVSGPDAAVLRTPLPLTATTIKFMANLPCRRGRPFRSS